MLGWCRCCQVAGHLELMLTQGVFLINNGNSSDCGTREKLYGGGGG